MIKKFIIFGFSVLLFLSAALTIRAEETTKIPIYLFWAKGCPHCQNEKIFLSKLKDKYPGIKLQLFEVGEDLENIKLLERIGKKLNAQVGAIPFTVVGNQYFIGFYNDKTTGEKIEKAVICVQEGKCPDIIEDLVNSSPPANEPPLAEETIPSLLSLPFLGKVNIKNVSLPVLSITIGLLDGFNPCAMWTLLFLISLLLGMKDRKRMWILGTVFIVSSAFVYFLFLTAWLNFFLLIGWIIWVRVIVGLVALATGTYNLKEFFSHKEQVCKVTKNKNRKQVFEKLKKITLENRFLFALVGIILLAFAVNVVELVCSAGLPAVYTQILSANKLSRLGYFLNIVLYIFFFMLDDLVVFVAAMVTLKSVGIEKKYGRFSNLYGGILILIIGILLLLKPEWLMFG